MADINIKSEKLKNENDNKLEEIKDNQELKKIDLEIKELMRIIDLLK